MKTIVGTILEVGFAEFSRHGEKYLIQPESNKGCHYLKPVASQPQSGLLVPRLL